MRRVLAVLVVLGVAVLVSATASAHVERSSYWPDPAPDTAVKPAAGGKVPKARGLFTALKRKPPGSTRVVCRPGSLKKAIRSIRSARKSGFRVRPTVAKRKLTKRQAKRLRRFNRKAFKRCKFGSIQSAVFRSKNNDRIVVMPGRYLEKKSRAQPKDDPKCASYRETSEKGEGAASYRYQVNCPNDQSLIYVQGRALTDTPVPNPPNETRHGIPDAGACVRCNLQIEGSGPKAEDVLIDAGKDPKAPLRKLGEPVKDVIIRADRADGIVIRRVTAAHALEHGFYVHETDGYLLDRIKAFYNGEYGTLTFTSDHGLTRDCEAVGHGDSGVYPGAAVDTGEQTPEPSPRLNQAITRCDVHHNTLGYSGTMGNATHVYNNNFYDNSTGIATDSFFAGGHPGYPQDGAVFENNSIYSNNFNSYEAGSDVIPRVPVPVGTGILIAGGNGNTVRGNRIWDNWRRGAMLIAVPDAVSGETGAGTTSNRNRFHGNFMGIGPGGAKLPNGVDFWWDQYPGNTNNCWYDNGDVTTDPQAPFMPSSCENTSSGVFYPTRSAELGGCAGSLEFGDETRTGGGSNPQYDENACPWFRSPPKPGSASAASAASTVSTGDALRFARVVGDMCDLVSADTLACDAFRDRP
jgi:Right handed beta helix region